MIGILGNSVQREFQSLMRAITSQRCSAFPPIKSLLSILPNPTSHDDTPSLPSFPLCRKRRDEPRAFCEPAPSSIFSVRISLLAVVSVGYVSFRTFSKWHWKNSRAHNVHGDAAEPKEAWSPPSRALRGDSLYVPWHPTPVVLLFHAERALLFLQFLQDGARSIFC